MSWVAILRNYFVDKYIACIKSPMLGVDNLEEEYAMIRLLVELGSGIGMWEIYNH